MAPVDKKTTLQTGLAAAPFYFKALSFCALLGVSQDITPDAIDLIFRFFRTLPSGSELVREFRPPPVLMPAAEAAFFDTAAALSAARGEPWLMRWRPAELKTRLEGLGFVDVFHLTPETANARYFNYQNDDLSAWSAVQMIRARV